MGKGKLIAGLKKITALFGKAYGHCIHLLYTYKLCVKHTNKIMIFSIF